MSRGGLTWISSANLRYFKYNSSAFQIVLYSSLKCIICRQKLVPIFEEFSTWPLSYWRAHGYTVPAQLQFSAIDTVSNARPTQSESRGILRVPCIQMWAPSAMHYAPKLYCKWACKRLSYNALRHSLVAWIVKHANGI